MKINHLVGEHKSVWLGTSPETNFQSWEGEGPFDVAVLGGGIAGITAAYYLKMAGLKVAVLDMRRIINGVTANTTAKITSAHRLIYRYLLSAVGLKKTRLYAEANQWAIEEIGRNIEKNSIDCDFQRTEAYTYTEKKENINKIKNEVRVAKKIGLPISFVEESPLPFSIKGAIRYENQALFHPRKYLLYLANKIDGGGSRIFENTRFFDVKEGNPCIAVLERGQLVARNIIIASNYPFLMKGSYFSRLYPKRSYALAAKLNSAVPRGMFITVDDPFNSIRHHTLKEKGDIVIIGGQNHRTGTEENTAERYRKLQEYASERFSIKSIEYHWSTHDSVSIDRVPYIGKLTSRTKNIFVTAGFGGWGMTTSAVSGKILCDLILGNPNPWASVFSPLRRMNIKASPGFLSHNIRTGINLLRKRFERFPVFEVQKLGLGEAMVFELNGRKVGVFKDEENTIHAVSITCTHMGCQLSWNNAEETWDCPCHGSRFSFDGELIHGPAVRNLERIVI